MAKKFTGWLATYKATLQRKVAVIGTMNAAMVELDIEKRTHDSEIGRLYAANRNWLITELDAVGMSEAEFCASLGWGESLSTQRRRMQLVPQAAWERYVQRRRGNADPGCYNLEYPVYLSRDTDSDAGTRTSTRNKAASVASTFRTSNE